MSDTTIIVNRDSLHHYKLKITTLSPVHIGTGEVYEPTDYIIDKNVLHHFDPILFFKSLDFADKEKFDKSLQDYMQMIDFYKSKRAIAIAIANFKCSTSEKVQGAYDKRKNKNNTKNKNQLHIEKTFKNPNTFRPIIPGSSIKGMLETALEIYPEKVEGNEQRQNLIISDALLLKGSVEIGYANRKHRDPNKSSNNGIPQIIEVIKPKSEFIFTISCDKTFDDIKKSLKNYHSKRSNSRYRDTADSFSARVGKNVGMDYIVNVENVDTLKNSYKKPLATHFLYESDMLKDEQFGWVTIERIDDEIYTESLQQIQNQETEYFKELEKSQYSIKQKIQQKKETTLRLQKEKEERLLAEQREKEEKAKKREEELSKLSPLEKQLEEMVENDKANTPKSTLLHKAIENGDLKKDLESLELLKKILIDEKKWKKTTQAKKPEKDKNYQRTLKIDKSLKELKNG